MSNENKNDMAFPLISPDGMSINQGLTKREYFAAMFMQPMIAGEGAKMVAERDERYNGQNWKEIIASNAIEFADELLKQLENGK